MRQGFDKVSFDIYQKLNMSFRAMRRYWFVGAMFVAQSAHAAKISGMTSGWKTEWASMVSFVLLVVAGLGVLVAAFSVISWIIAAKRQEPAKWQLFGVLGGAAAVIIPVIVLAFAGSLSGEQGDADGTFSDLDIKY